MARGRMLSKSLSTSEKFASVSGHLVEFCHALYPLLISHTDDFGRLQGDPFTVKRQCYPASVRTLDDFADALLELHRVELIHWYVVGGKRYLQIDNFDPHQLGLHKRTRSRFPEVPGSSGKFPEIPSEEKRTEQEQEEKGTGREQEENRTGKEPNPREVHVPPVASLPLVSVSRVKAATALAHHTSAQSLVVRRAAKDGIAALKASFEEFWTHWPKHVAKKAAEREWLRLKPSVTLFDIIVQAVEAQKLTRDWQKDDGHWIPHPATWLHNHRWDDEIGTAAGVSPISEQSQRNVEAGRRVVARMAGRPV